MEKLKVLFILVAVKLCDGHGHFSHQSILDTSITGLFSGVNKVHEVASAVVGKIPGLNLNFESNVQVGGGNYRPQQPQYPNYNQPQKKPDEVVIVVVDERPGGQNGQGTPQYPKPPPHHGQKPHHHGQGGYNPNYQGYRPDQNYPNNNNYQPNFPSNNYQPSSPSNNNNYKPSYPNNNPSNNYQPNYPSNNYQPNYPSNNYQPSYPNNNKPQEDCGPNENPYAGKPQHGYGGGGNNKYPNYDNTKPSFNTSPSPVNTPKWHDNENAQTFPTANPTKTTDSGFTPHSQEPGQGPTDNQGYLKPADHDDKEKNKIETADKPAGDDEPLLVPLNPNEYVYGGDKIMINAPKRETQKETSSKAPVKDEDEEFPIDIRFGD